MLCSLRQTARWGVARALILALLALGSGPAAADGRHVVVAGDTPRTIAAAHAVDLSALLAANQIAAETALEPGRVLVVPDPRPAVYRVQAGDNLFRISQKFQLSVETLAAANQLVPDSILQIGQELKLPGGATVPPAEAITPPSEKPEPTPAQPAPPGAAPSQPRPSRGPNQLPETVWVCEARVHLRSAPSTAADSLRLVPYGTALRVLGKDEMWWKVRLPGSERGAFVAGWVVRTTPAQQPKAADRLAVAYVAQERVNIRSAASTDSPRVAVAVQGTRMEVLQIQPGWLRVRFDNGTEGWLAEPLARMASGRSTEEATALGRRLADTAVTYLGTPYASGGESHAGADCSGLVYATCLEHGIRLPRSSRAMYGAGTPIDRGALQPGDLVFFSNTYRSGISHVGVYIGNNEFVHAVRPGERATITSLSNDYYARHYAGARRVAD